MTRIKIEITKDANGLKKGQIASVVSPYAQRMVASGNAKYVNDSDAKMIKEAQDAVKNNTAKAQKSSVKTVDEQKAYQQKLDDEAKENAEKLAGSKFDSTKDEAKKPVEATAKKKANKKKK